MPVVVIGEDVHKNAVCHGGSRRQDRSIVDGHEYQVLGVMKRPANSFPGQQDNRVLHPVLDHAQDHSRRPMSTC